MIIEKTYQGILIYDLVNGALLKNLYIGYSKKDAVRAFKALKSASERIK